MAPAVPVPFLPAAPPDLLQTALELSLTGFILFRPVYSAADPLTPCDLAYEYVNPAAQRMLQLPERPAESFLTLYPSAVETGIFAFHRDTFVAGEASQYAVNYQHDGLDNYFHLADRRCGDLLLMSFTDTADQPRTPVEEALRASQAREQAARAEIERQRGELQRLLEQAPVALATFTGPRYVIQMANPAVLRMWGRTREQTLHTPLFELLPETAGQGFEELLDEVMATGVPYVAHELPSVIDREGHRDTVYWNFVYQPLRGEQGQVTGVTVVATEVTEQVLARQQLEQLLQQRETLYQLFEQSSALICILRGPEHRYEYHNPAFRQLYAGRDLVGRPAADTQPEAVAHAFVPLLDQAYQRGERIQVDQVPGQGPHPPGGGPQKYYHFSYQPYREQGSVAGVSVFVVDITEQVQTRQQAEEARQALREQRAVGQAVLEAQEEERRRIAEALHNGIGQLLTAAHMHLEGVADRPAGLLAAAQILQQAIEAVRTLSAELTPSVLEELGLARALRQLSGLYPPQRLHVHWHLEGLDTPLPRLLAIAVYRLVQELLTNVVKHAHTPEARVHVVREPEQVLVIVEDNGVGFAVDAPGAPPTGVGLLSLRHRVLALGGQVRIQSQPGRGTIVSLELPLADPTRAAVVAS